MVAEAPPAPETAQSPTVAPAQPVVHLPALHPAQQQIRDHPARFKVVAAGRRFGKTRLGVLLAMACAIQGGRSWWVAPFFKLTAPAWRTAKTLARQLPGVVVRESELLVTFASGGTFQVRSADTEDGLRSEGLDFVVYDECAFGRESAWTEELRPALLDRRGKALFISSPNGINWFWRLFQRGQDPHFPAWQSWQFPTSANPFISPEEIEELKQDSTEETIAREIDAKFLDSGSGVFRNVEAVSTALPLARPLPGREYVVGVDWGKKDDFTVVTVWDVNARVQVYLDRFNQLDYRVQVSRLQLIHQRFRPILIIAEQNSIGEPLIEFLLHYGLPVYGWIATNASKKVVIETYQLGFERQHFRLLKDKVQIAEHQAFQITQTLSKMVRYAAPDGMHDDTVIANALAYTACLAPREQPRHISWAGGGGRALTREDD